jgi:hypothetical protein
MTLFIHWFPKNTQQLMRNFILRGLIVRPNPQECENFVNEIKLLTYQEMDQLFPDTSIMIEKFLGTTKLLITIKTQ